MLSKIAIDNLDHEEIVEIWTLKRRKDNEGIGIGRAECSLLRSVHYHTTGILYVFQDRWGLGLTAIWFVGFLCWVVCAILNYRYSTSKMRGHWWCPQNARAEKLVASKPLAEFNSTWGFSFLVFEFINFIKEFAAKAVNFSNHFSWKIYCNELSLTHRKTWNCHSCGSAPFPDSCPPKFSERKFRWVNGGISSPSSFCEKGWAKCVRTNSRIQHKMSARTIF